MKHQGVHPQKPWVSESPNPVLRFTSAHAPRSSLFPRRHGVGAFGQTAQALHGLGQTLEDEVVLRAGEGMEVGQGEFSLENKMSNIL